jgi:hypothetical protein
MMKRILLAPEGEVLFEHQLGVSQRLEHLGSPGWGRTAAE